MKMHNIIGSGLFTFCFMRVCPFSAAQVTWAYSFHHTYNKAGVYDTKVAITNGDTSKYAKVNEVKRTTFTITAKDIEPCLPQARIINA